MEENNFLQENQRIKSITRKSKFTAGLMASIFIGMVLSIVLLMLIIEPSAYYFYSSGLLPNLLVDHFLKSTQFLLVFTFLGGTVGYGVYRYLQRSKQAKGLLRIDSLGVQMTRKTGYTFYVFTSLSVILFFLYLTPRWIQVLFFGTYDYTNKNNPGYLYLTILPFWFFIFCLYIRSTVRNNDRIGLTMAILFFLVHVYFTVIMVSTYIMSGGF
ncbi:MAG: hypothetical protein Q8R55_07540 [Candidatus Taylorbacteria bacterium]|nr:hypothetical protein [Candidatus Taylorbacteria bacterium]